MRRGAVNKSFSRAKIQRLEPEIHELVQMFCDKLLGWAGKPPLDLAVAYACFTSDVIWQYSFGESHGFVAQKDGWANDHKKALVAFTQSIYLLRFAPATRSLAAVAPYIQDLMPKHMGTFFKDLTVRMPLHIRKAAEEKAADDGSGNRKGRIFADLLDSDLPESEKSIERLSGEGFSFTTAGTETTAATLAYVTYILLTKPEVCERLTADLQGVNPNHLNWQSLEKYVYLYGVIQESFRLSYGISARSARIARNEDLYYKSSDDGGKHEYMIPRGWAIGMSARILHHDEAKFPDNEAFRPERWITPDGQRNVQLEKYLLTFSRGSRHCLGYK